jgi:hypothetical protein
MLSFALSKLELHTDLAHISFAEENDFNKSILSDTEADECNFTIQSLSDCHNIHYMANADHRTPLDCLCNYAVHLITTFETVLKRYDNTEVLEKPAIMKPLFRF